MGNRRSRPATTTVRVRPVYSAPAPAPDEALCSVLFELLPFYERGDAAVDALLRRTVASMKDRDAVDKDGNTALILCAMYSHYDLAKSLVDRGADVDAVSTAGVTALSYACGARPLNEALVRLLVDRGARTNVPELHSGCAALHYLASTGNIELCDCLIANGAVADLRDFYGWTPADYARDAGFDTCAHRLRASNLKRVVHLEAKIDEQRRDLNKLRTMVAAALAEAELHRAKRREAEDKLKRLTNDVTDDPDSVLEVRSVDADVDDINDDFGNEQKSAPPDIIIEDAEQPELQLLKSELARLRASGAVPKAPSAVSPGGPRRSSTAQPFFAAGGAATKGEPESSSQT